MQIFVLQGFAYLLRRVSCCCLEVTEAFPAALVQFADGCLLPVQLLPLRLLHACVIYHASDLVFDFPKVSHLGQRATCTTIRHSQDKFTCCLTSHRCETVY